MSEQRGALRGGVEIVVATPGRLIDHLQQRNTALNRVSLIVLDEADRMLDMGFEPSIAEIMAGLPTRHQTLLFSATMPVEIEELANKYFSDPVRLKVRTQNAMQCVLSLRSCCQLLHVNTSIRGVCLIENAC
jgi:ATP-dependent RNA helicase DDX5/DBP2